MFLKNISNYSISVYKDLCSSVRKSFKAISVRQGNSSNLLEILDSAVVPKAISFSAWIDKLQDKNIKLSYTIGEIRTSLLIKIES